MKRVLLMSLGCLVVMAGMAFAGSADDARFCLHVQASGALTSTKLCGTQSPNAANLPCDDYTLTGSVGVYYTVYWVVGHMNAIGLKGVSFGIDYNGRAGAGNGLDPNSNIWIKCADGQDYPNDGGFGDFPAPKGGNIITWVNCQTNDIGGKGAHVIIGGLNCYAYAPDLLQVTPNNNLQGPPELAVVGCDNTTTELLDVFPSYAWYSLMAKASFGGASGALNPCLIVPARETTWGKMKDLYNKN